MLRVAVDAAPLLGDRTGIGVAVTGMISELAGRSDLTLVGYGLTGRGWGRLGTVLPRGVGRSRAPMPAGPLQRIWRYADVPVVEWWTGPIDVVHGTNFVVPPSRRAGRVVTVWDLTAVRFPEMCTPVARRYPELVARAVARGAWVHAGAHFIADEIVEHFRIQDPSRVRVVPPGVDAPLAAAEPGPAQGPPYILGLGTSEPRKDFPGLVAAFDLIADRHPDLELRLAGPPGWAEQDLELAIASAGHRSRIRRLGWVDNPLPLIAGAALFAYPSLYEGFGLPPLEAMIAGVPVVASNAGAVPEVVGDAALLVGPRDSEALATAMDQVLSDDEVRQRLIEAGRVRAAQYTWSRAADQMIEFYTDVKQGRRSKPRTTRP